MSIIIPCRNEERFIAQCLDSIVASRFPRDRLEVLVIDGMSDDGTQAVLKTYSAQYPFIRVLDNPKRITPVAFNIGIQHARGQLLMIMSAHATFTEDAIAKCVEFSGTYAADNVGGHLRIVPRGNTFLERCVVAAMSHPFGAGNAVHRTSTSSKPRWADTVAFGCYRRDVFERIGVFNERLVRGQDMEFNLRLKRAGGRTLFVPDIILNYYARSGFVTFCRHNFLNGLWAILPFLHSTVMPVAWRHLVPLIFVLSLLGSTITAVSPLGWWALGLTVSSYSVANLAASATIAWRERSGAFFLVLPLVFASLHVSYGIGSLAGLVRIAQAHMCKRWSQRREGFQAP